MSGETASQLQDFVGELLEGKSKLSVTFYGGEPLLYVKQMQQLCKAFQELAARSTPVWLL